MEETNIKPSPRTAQDRLYLASASGLPEFRPAYDALSHMGFYNFNPDRIRDPQAAEPGDLLLRDGSNLTSVLSQLSRRQHHRKQRIEEYLAKVVPGIKGVDVKVMGSKATLEFRQQVAGADEPWRFPAASMSDGTLRALGILVSLFQGGNGEALSIPLVGIEEPETALHPAAAGVLLDSLREASHGTQVMVTSHSPDLLDDTSLDTSAIFAVVAENGVTNIAPVSESGRSALKDGLYTAGELLRMDQLQPDPESVAEQMKLRLFEKGNGE